MPLSFRQITKQDLSGLSPERTLFIFAAGGCEDHGPHLPLAIDLIEAETVARLTAERLESEMPGWRAVLMPSAPLAIEGNVTALSLTVRPYVLRDWLVDTCRALHREGFRYFACVSGFSGPKQLSAIEEAGQLLARNRWGFPTLGLRRKLVFLSLSSAGIEPRSVWRSPFWPDAKEHGGCRDTSVALAIDPMLARPMHQTLPERALEPGFWGRALSRARKKTHGYWGNPAQATGEEGMRELTAQVDLFFPKLRAVLEGAPARSNFRTYYSVLPPNRSFFKAWILAFATLLMLFAWILLTLKGIET